MHKLYLTEPECEIINGAKDIINIIGGFPSMEDGELIEIKTNKKSNSSFGEVSILFDISGWKRTAAYYSGEKTLNNFKENLIRLDFQNVRDVKITDPFSACGEIKFSNTADFEKMFQDDTVSNTSILKRPFCCFYISSRNVIIEFDEKTCNISAHFEKSI